MDSISVELLENVSNNAVIRLPGREYPGVVIQGDTLNNLYLIAKKISQLAHDTQSDDLKDYSQEMQQLLLNAIGVYEAALKKHNIELPYFRAR